MSQFTARCPVCGAIADFLRKVDKPAPDPGVCVCGMPGCASASHFAEGRVLGWDGGCGCYLALEDYRIWLDSTGPEFMPAPKRRVQAADPEGPNESLRGRRRSTVVGQGLDPAFSAPAIGGCLMPYDTRSVQSGHARLGYGPGSPPNPPVMSRFPGRVRQPSSAGETS